MSLVKFKTTSGEKMKKVDSMTVFNTEEVDTTKQPMFFGKPLGIQRYDNYKYPVFERLTTQQLGYFWRPEEVSLQKDRSCLLYTSPSPRDQRGSRMPSCG